MVVVIMMLVMVTTVVMVPMLMLMPDGDGDHSGGYSGDNKDGGDCGGAFLVITMAV